MKRVGGLMDTSQLKALVVDDDDDAIFTMCAILESMNLFHSIVGRDEASKCAIDLGTFDVLITDFNMRGLNGIQLARAYKILNPHGYCIMISGVCKSPLSNDVDLFFRKPIPLNEFQNSLTEWLTKSSVRTPIRSITNQLEINHD